MKPAVKVRAVSKSYKDLVALQGVDMVVEQGQLYGLIGPNGSGKSTLVKILCGLLRPDGGEIYVLGWRVPNPRIWPQIGYMPQDVALYADLTVWENLIFFGELYQVPRAQLKERGEELLQLVKLVDRRDQTVGTLSGGMQRRASLAVSLINRPALLFLDEPTVGVDPLLRLDLWAHFQRLSVEGVTVIITTHVMEEAARCRKVGLLSKGKLIAEDTPQELQSQAGVQSLEEVFTTLEEQVEARS